MQATRSGRIHGLRDKMWVVEDAGYSADYLDPEKGSIANAVRIRFRAGDSIDSEVEYPLGHRRRRDQGIPLLKRKFEANLRTRLSEKRASAVSALFLDHERLSATGVGDLLALLEA